MKAAVRRLKESSEHTSPLESGADSHGSKNSIGQDYGGGCATRKGMGRGMEMKQRWMGCTQTGNPLPFVTAIVASNSGDLG